MAERDDFWRKIGFLTDEAEIPLYNAGRLRENGINQFTTGSVLYLLATHEVTAPIIGRLTGIPASRIEAESKEFLVSKYRNVAFDMQPQPELDELIKKTIQIAGGTINKAGVEHLLLSMFSMPNAKRYDAYQILHRLGIEEKNVKENSQSRDIKDKTVEIALSNTAYLSTKTGEINEINVLTRLTRNPETKLLIVGEVGSGKHNLLINIARALNVKEYPGLKQKKLVEIDSNLLSKAQEKNFDPEKASPETLYFADFSKLTPEEIKQLGELKWKTPIFALGGTKDDAASVKDKWEIVEISPYSLDEVAKIVEKHQLVQTGENKLQQLDPEKTTKLLVRYGPTLFPTLALPAAAIELLKMAVADSILLKNKTLSPKTIAEIISRHGTNVSAEVLLQDENSKMLKVEEYLHQRIIGQDEAVGAVAEHLRIRASELKSGRKRPIGNFIFLGPTGVGKTELGKALAEFLFDDENNLIRIDLTEYQEGHSVSRLIGSPPGYVGHDDGGQLTEAVRRKPFSVVMFDEVDKAHPAVLNPLLQIMDDGRLTDGKGKTIDFSQTVIIMTSNHFAEQILTAIESGQDVMEVKEAVKAGFKKVLKPEFINRIDEIIVFDPITRDQAAKILELQLEKEVTKPLLEAHGVEIVFEEAAKAELVRRGFDPRFGGRPLLRTISKEVKSPLSKLILGEKIKKNSKLVCAFEKGNIVLNLR